MKRAAGSSPVQILLLLLVCALVYWTRLGVGGLHSTEAHRVVPAYEMLDHGHWLVPRMFGQPYLRKPPGMPWAIAGMSELLGRTPFAARAVSALSATLMAVVAFGFARRWFGPRAALAAGLAQALMPVMWETGRAAEIEALNNLGTQIAALCLIDALVFARTRRVRILGAITAAAGVVWFALAKGPASLPVVLAVVAAACVAKRSIKPLLGPVWITITLAGGVVGMFAWLILRAAGAEPVDPIYQSPEAFLFEPGRLVGVATLIPAAFIQSLPVSLALLFPWGRDARDEAAGDETRERAFSVARVLAWAWLIAVGLFMVMGVRNPRYTLPAAVLIPPLVGDVVAGLGCWLHPRRERIARVLLLGRPAAWPTVLLVAAGVYIGVIEPRRRGTSGTPVGQRLGAAIADWASARGIEQLRIEADGLIEARPEVLLAVEQSAPPGISFLIRWDPTFRWLQDHSAGTDDVLLLLRDDASSDESEQVIERFGGRLTPVIVDNSTVWKVHKYRFRLYLLKF